MMSRKVSLAALALVLGVPASAAAQPAPAQPAPAQAASAQAAAGQTGATNVPPPPAFNTVRTPSSPAFTLFGLSTSGVERPNTPADLALTLLSKTSVDGRVPENFAVEVSPYWMAPHPTLRWQDDVSRNPKASVARTATISAATGQIGTTGSRRTALSIGARASLMSGRLTGQTTSSIEKLQKLLQQEAGLIVRLVNERLIELYKQFTAGTLPREQYAREVDQLMKQLAASAAFRESPESAAVKSAVQKLATNREGFFLEVASAAGWSFPDAVWSQGGFDRWAAWVTPSYQVAKYSATGVFRFTSNDPDNSKGAFDLGGRGTFSADRYAFSGELVYRTFRASDLSARHRAAGIVEYEVRNGTWLVMSFGHDQNSSREGSALAQIGLSFNLSRERFKLEP